MKLEVLKVPGRVLKGMPPEDRLHVVQFCHLANSISVLQKLLAYTFQKSNVDLIWKANVTQGSLMGRMLAGVIVEGWKILKPFLDSNRGQKVIARISAAGKTDAQALADYSAKPNPIKRLRDKFAFHFDPATIRQELDVINPDRDYHLYLAQHQGNTLFYLGEEIVESATIDCISEFNKEQDPRKVYAAIYADLVKIARLMLQVTHEVVAVIVLDHLPGLTRSDLEVLHIPDGPEIQDIWIPYFTVNEKNGA
jgi:hypothetical protein